MRTALASGVPSTLSPEAARPCPALQSEGVGESRPALLQCPGAGATVYRLSEEKVGQPSQGASTWHPSLPQNSQPRGALALWGEEVSRDEGEPVQENHFSLLGHFTLTDWSPLLADIDFEPRPSSVSSLI